MQPTTALTISTRSRLAMATDGNLAPNVERDAASGLLVTPRHGAGARKLEVSLSIDNPEIVLCRII